MRIPPSRIALILSAVILTSVALAPSSGQRWASRSRLASTQ
jgi:hypothetical protein